MRYNLFIYGAFSRGQVHYPKISQMIVGEKQAFVKACAYRLRCGYPILDITQEESLMEGVLADLEASENFWSILDPLLGVNQSQPEKCFLNRRLVEVMVDDFTRLKAQVYCINPRKITKAHEKITGNQWPDLIKKEPGVMAQLQDRHRHYISRLSKIKSRNVVPIDLELYRELLSMEMIVDRGRRLALSPLGKEVSLFIS